MAIVQMDSETGVVSGSALVLHPQPLRKKKTRRLPINGAVSIVIQHRERRPIGPMGSVGLAVAS